MTDFLLTPELSALRTDVRAFVDEHVIPNEDAVLAEDAKGERTTLDGLQAIAKSRGLWTPHLPEEWGGRGLGPMGMCAVFRELGRSYVGAKSCNCDAPDQGNMDLLLRVASDAIRERWLGPLVRDEITSAFCMTEPAPGAGSDPQNLRTTATQDGDDWLINGHKWFSTGGEFASFLIVMARTSDDRREGASLFVVDRRAPGIEFVRDIPTMGTAYLAHREAELRFTNVRVPAVAVLGGIGQGFSLAQARLVPARLTHCMRWLGNADRTLDLCRSYIKERTAFGKPLSHHGATQRKIADNAMAIHQGNLMTLHCAMLLEAGDARAARPYSSMAKNHVAKLLCNVLDDAIQMHGALGFSEDMPFSRWYKTARAARIADGPDEVHEMVVARDWLAGRLNLLV